MVFTAIFNVILFTSGQSVHLPMLSWNSCYQYSTRYNFQASGCFSTGHIVLSAKSLATVTYEYLIPGRFTPKPFPPLVVSPPSRFPPGRFPPGRFAPLNPFAPPPGHFLPSRFAPKII